MIIRTTIVLALMAAAVILAGCDGPTKAGKEARAAAQGRMNLMGAQINFDQARQAFSSGQFDKAQREIANAIKRYGEAPEYYLLQGRIHLETHQLEAALNSFRAAIELSERQASSGKPAPSNAGGKIVAEACYFAGIVYQRWSDDQSAYSSYVRASKIEPTKVQYLLATAEALVALGRFDEAKAAITAKLAYFEHNAALRQLLGQIAMLQNDPAGAAVIFGQARLLNPDDDMLLEELMWSQYAAGQYGPCLDSIKQLAARTSKAQPRGAQSQSTASADASRPDLVHLEARCLCMMNRSVEARERYIELTKLKPSDPVVWSELGTLSWDLGDYRRVAQCSVQLISQAPDRYEGYMLKGIYERQKGNLAEAVKLLQQACQRTQVSALPHLLLGQMLEQAGNTQAAAVAYNRAAAVQPNSAEARELLRRLTEERRFSAAPTE